MNEGRRWAVVFGYPVQHSLSPRLHNAAFAAAGIDAHYDRWEVAPDQLASKTDALRAADCLGANVTAPHKLAITAYLDALSDDARVLGAVNTVVNEGGQLIGHNTDASGLASWLAEAAVPVAGADVVVLGAGGAARATVLALARSGAKSVVVLNRSIERATVLVTDLQGQVGEMGLSAGPLARVAERASESVPLLVNCTSLSHAGVTPEIHPTWYGADSVAIDLAYNPPDTVFMQAARAAGAGRTENGLGMLIHQAAHAFERWLHTPAPLAAYKQAAAETVAHP